jgi:beta-glucosidase
MDKPLKELKGFVKTKLLKPGEKQTFSFVLDAGDLASFDAGKSAWVVERGDYSIQIGPSSKNIKQTVLFHVPNDIEVEKVNKVLMAQTDIEEFK